MTCHDVAFLHVPETYQPGVAESFIEGLRRGLKFVDAILVDSRHTQEDLVDHFNVPTERVRVAYPAVVNRAGQSLHLPSSFDSDPVHQASPPLFLVVGELNARKNALRVIDAFARVVSEVDQQLVFVGPGGAADYSNAVKRHACAVLPPNRVIFAGMISDGQLASLYDRCTALLHCSLYEGFGYPVAEAAARGVPVITSDVSSLPEVAGPAALLVDPTSTESIAEALRRVATDAPLRAALAAAGPYQAERFTDEALFRVVVDLYTDLGA
jgi:glycosyltransferase involved in cell wall biosynthesis